MTTIYRKSPQQPKVKGDGMIHTPSPTSDENGPYSGAKIHYSAPPEKGKHNGPLENVPPAKVPKVRYDINISFRISGQQMFPAKTPKTCVAQFCIMNDPQAYEDIDFYNNQNPITKNKIGRHRVSGERHTHQWTFHSSGETCNRRG